VLGIVSNPAQHRLRWHVMVDLGRAPKWDCGRTYDAWPDPRSFSQKASGHCRCLLTADWEH
jgi:hypothetical protein